MWFDLALALGSTVHDLKARMPLNEFSDWVAYVELYGPVDYRRRFDEPAALIASTVSWSVGGKRPFKDFIRALPEINSDLSDTDKQIKKAFGNKR